MTGKPESELKTERKKQEAEIIIIIIIMFLQTRTPFSEDFLFVKNKPFCDYIITCWANVFCFPIADE